MKIKKILQELFPERIGPISVKYKNEIINLTPEICSRCSGTGKTLYGSLEGHAFTQSDLEEDPDFLEDMQNGKYNVQCGDCDGIGVILTYTGDNEELLSKIIEIKEYEKECKQEHEMQLRMGGVI